VVIACTSAAQCPGMVCCETSATTGGTACMASCPAGSQACLVTADCPAGLGCDTMASPRGDLGYGVCVVPPEGGLPDGGETLGDGAAPADAPAGGG
jgi:hypothetical protein